MKTNKEEINSQKKISCFEGKVILSLLILKIGLNGRIFSLSGKLLSIRNFR